MACGIAYSGPLATVPSGSRQPGTIGTHVAGIRATAPPTARASMMPSPRTLSGARLPKSSGLRPSRSRTSADHLPGGIAQQFGHPGLQLDLDALFPESPGEELGDQPGAEGQDIAAGRACCGRAAAPAREHVLVRAPGAEVGADPEPGPPRPQRTALERAAGQVASGCERTVGLDVIIGEPAD